MTMQHVTDFIDRHQRIVQIAITTTAIAGVLTIGRSVRLVTKFQDAKDIPKEFVRIRIQLRGQVESVEDGIIAVNHLPILSLPWNKRPSRKDSSCYLRLYLAGVSLHQTEGGEFMKTALKEHPTIWFRLLSIDDSGRIEAVVKVQKHAFSSTNLNIKILRLGLGKTQALLAPSSTYTRLLTQKLLKAEIYSERKKRGLWKTPSVREQLSEAASIRIDSIRKWVHSRGERVYQFPQRLTAFFRNFFKRK